MGTIIIILVVLVLFFIVAAVLYKQVAKFTGRIKDYCAYKGVSASFLPIVVMAVGIGFIITYAGMSDSIGDFFSKGVGMWLSVAAVAIPVLILLFKSGLSFWKVIILRILVFPFFIVQGILGAVSGHEKRKTKRNWDGSQTEYYYRFPAEIYTEDGWELEFVYNLAGTRYYEHSDGTRCIVHHKHTMSFEDVQYDVIPLYNVNYPAPWWIRWMY